MSINFEQISIKPGFMKHNGGVLFRTISDTEYEFKTIINENHLNAAEITHGGYLSALIDAGAGTAAHRASGNSPCVTISLDLKFIGASKVGDEIKGFAKILKKTNTLVFLFCELRCNRQNYYFCLWGLENFKSQTFKFRPRWLINFLVK
jgi:uncharacterized protein (TIGR00369 family)